MRGQCSYGPKSKHNHARFGLEFFVGNSAQIDILLKMIYFVSDKITHLMFVVIKFRNAFMSLCRC